MAAATIVGNNRGYFFRDPDNVDDAWLMLHYVLEPFDSHASVPPELWDEFKDVTGLDAITAMEWVVFKTKGTHPAMVKYAPEAESSKWLLKQGISSHVAREAAKHPNLVKIFCKQGD